MEHTFCTLTVDLILPFGYCDTDNSCPKHLGTRFPSVTSVGFRVQGMPNCVFWSFRIPIPAAARIDAYCSAVPRGSESAVRKSSVQRDSQTRPVPDAILALKCRRLHAPVKVEHLPQILHEPGSDYVAGAVQALTFAEF